MKKFVIFLFLLINIFLFAEEPVFILKKDLVLEDVYLNEHSFSKGDKFLFDYTKKYTLTFNARCAGEESGNNLGVVILNTDDVAAFCKGDLSGTLYTAGINNTDKSYSVTFDFGQKSTSVATSGITYSPTSSDDTNGGINIVFFNNTNTKNTGVASTLYVKNIKLEVVKE